MPLVKTQVLIVGAGLAGLYAALQFPPEIAVAVLCKGDQRICNSSLAQGGVAAVLDPIHDSPEQHIQDTLVAGAFACDEEAVRILVDEGPADVRKLIEWGCRFDRNAQGELEMTLEGGHTRRRIVHHKDSTGDEMTQTLMRRVLNQSNITLYENTFVYELEQAAGGFVARAGRDRTDKTPEQPAEEALTVAADYCILATGGIGRVYQYTTNSAIATGDGIALAKRLGANISHLSYVQFHPTAFAAVKGRERFLISEAVRGEGALLLNCDRERFMHRYDERLELAPRDVVSKSMILESRRTGSEAFYLDITMKSAAFLRERFPMIYERCLLEGVDITKTPIPVYPCQHYLMGGIEVNLFGRTRVDRLYAVGECACTGVHGKNRLASNSLLEALVFSRRAAQHILALSEFGQTPTPENATVPGGPPMPSGFRTAIREIVQQSFFVLPDPDAAARNLTALRQINRRLGQNKFAATRDYTEAKTLGSIAVTILEEITL